MSNAYRQGRFKYPVFARDEKGRETPVCYSSYELAVKINEFCLEPDIWIYRQAVGGSLDRALFSFKCCYRLRPGSSEEYTYSNHWMFPGLYNKRKILEEKKRIEYAKERERAEREKKE
jgi:hypothetical protein